jgi:serine phosphatase RsbU (regulator of sigma subunit)
MVQGMLHAQISAQATHVTSLAQTVQAVNAFVCSRAPAEKYVTLAILRYTLPQLPEDPAQIELINGGHVCPMIVRANGDVETVSDGDMPVGLLEFARFHAILVTLAPGDRLVLLSDGISEAEDPDGTQFGAEEMTQHLAKPDPVPSLFNAIKGFCKGAHAQDDQTVLTVDRLA